MKEQKDMVNGQRVEVKLHHDPFWYPGIVVRARKMWVRLDQDGLCNPHQESLVGETEIAEWRPLTDIG